ncbi:hypothetical protein J6590_068653 [Homalodisca vitripennis]|nr:hypothetical protein J6590_068653 [Homalodisca vitripennis]
MTDQGSVWLVYTYQLNLNCVQQKKVRYLNLGDLMDDVQFSGCTPLPEMSRFWSARGHDEISALNYFPIDLDKRRPLLLTHTDILSLRKPSKGPNGTREQKGLYLCAITLDRTVHAHADEVCPEILYLIDLHFPLHYCSTILRLVRVGNKVCADVNSSIRHHNIQKECSLFRGSNPSPHPSPIQPHPLIIQPTTTFPAESGKDYDFSRSIHLGAYFLAYGIGINKFGIQ